MPYTIHNYKYKKDLKADVDAGKEVCIYQPGPFGPDVDDGSTVIEGPHGYHKWYAAVEVKNNIITKFKG